MVPTHPFRKFPKRPRLHEILQCDNEIPVLLADAKQVIRYMRVFSGFVGSGIL